MNLPRVRSPPNGSVTGAATAQPSPLINARKLILINPTNGSNSSQGINSYTYSYNFCLYSLNHTEAVPITPRVLDISFLPHSVTEQWLLVQSVDELSLILEEIIAIYSSLSSNMKEKAKADISKVIRQIIVNMACEALQVVINGLKLMELFAEEHAGTFLFIYIRFLNFTIKYLLIIAYLEAFLPEVATLFPKLLRYFEDSRVVLRHHVSRLAYSLAAHLPFHVMDKFIVFAVEQGRKTSQGRPEYSFKLAVIALMRCIQVRANYRTTSVTSESSGMEDPVSTFQATHTAQQLSLVRIAATAAACMTSSDVITELTKDISIDIVGAVYKLLYPSLCEDADVDTLPEMFLDLLVLDEDCTINIPMQKVITKRAKNTLFSSILSDVTIYPLIQHLLGLSEADNEAEAINTAAYGTFVSPTPSAATLIPDEVAILSPSTPPIKPKYNFTLTLNSNITASPDPVVPPVSTPAMSEKQEKENVSTEIDSLKELFIDNSSKVEETTASAEVPPHSPNSKGSTSLFIEKPITTPNTSLYSPLPFALVKSKPSFLEAVEESPRDKDVDIMPPINRRDHDVSNSRRNSKDNIVKRDKHKRNNDHNDTVSALNYTPSWGSNSITLTSSDRTLDSPWTPNMLGESDVEDTKVTLSVDRSKLKSIKKAGKKPGSRRAHSAEVSTNLHDAHAVNDRTPNTSDGVRSISIAASNIIGGSSMRNGSKFKNTGDEEDGASIVKKYNNFNSVPNYLEETEQISRKREAFMERVALQVIDKNYTTENPDNSHSQHSHSTKKSIKTSPRQEKPFREEKLVENDTLSSYINKNYNKNNVTASTNGDKIPQMKRRNVPKPIEVPRDEEGDVDDVNTDTFYSQSERVPSLDQRKRRDQGGVAMMNEINENSSLLSPDRGRSTSINHSYFDSGYKPASTPTASTSGEYKSGLKPDALEYLDASEIEPSTNPTKEFNKAMLGLDTQDWPEIFNTLNSIRRIALHHRSLITNSGSLHSIIVGVLRQVDNLRSAVAKNAILTINDLFLGLNTVMDSEVVTIVNSVVKRCGDSSNFLGEVAENAILQMIDSVSSLRALHGLISNCEHRNSSIRGKVVGFMLVLLMRKGVELRGSRELDTLRLKLSKLLGDSAPEARAGSRSIVKLILEQGLYTKSELEQYISIDQINKSLKEQTPLYTSDPRGAARY